MTDENVIGTWSFFSPNTGEISGRRYSGPKRYLEDNTPDGHIPILGEFDALCQRVIPETLEVVCYQPPQPSPDHIWIDDTRRWEKRPEILEAERRTARAKRIIERLEQDQLRPLRELYLDSSNQLARQKLMQIDAEIALHRRQINSEVPLDE